VIVLEVRNAELMDSITRQAAEHGITDGAIVALIRGEVMAGREAAPPPGPSRAEVPRSLA
jgi:hypothetical protein